MKKVIYGTGYVAERIYNELCEDGYAQDIAFFIDSLVEKKSFLGIKVVTPDYLLEINPNDYEYYLGSIGSQNSMRMELIARDVNEKNIILNNDYSEANFEKKIDNIERILVYPPVKDGSIEKKLREYLFDTYNYVEFIYARTKEDIFLDVDLVLVWDKAALKYARKRKDGKVYCIDKEFYGEIDYRILGRLGCKLHKQKYGDEYNEIAIKNMRDIVEKGYKDAYVFGNGPSLDEGIRYYKKWGDNSLKIVCNGIVTNGGETLESLKPTGYAFVDAVYLDKEFLRAVFMQALQFSYKKGAYIICPYFWSHYIANWYPKIKDRIIGLELIADSIQFPTYDNMKVYRKAGNVITNIAIPFASSIVDKIYVSGCDGTPKIKSDIQIWNYSELCQENYIIEAYRNEDVLDQHNKYFEELLEYGESKGKIYQSITDSYIPALAKRKIKDKEN